MTSLIIMLISVYKKHKGLTKLCRSCSKNEMNSGSGTRYIPDETDCLQRNL